MTYKRLGLNPQNYNYFAFSWKAEILNEFVQAELCNCRHNDWKCWLLRGVVSEIIQHLKCEKPQMAQQLWKHRSVQFGWMDRNWNHLLNLVGMFFMLVEEEKWIFLQVWNDNEKCEKSAFIDLSSHIKSSHSVYWRKPDRQIQGWISVSTQILLRSQLCYLLPFLVTRYNKTVPWSSWDELQFTPGISIRVSISNESRLTTCGAAMAQDIEQVVY